MSATQKLQAGDKAPGFKTVDVYGNPVDLSKMDTKHILVIFNIYGRHVPKPPFPIVADHQEAF